MTSVVDNRWRSGVHGLAELFVEGACTMSEVKSLGYGICMGRLDFCLCVSNNLGVRFKLADMLCTRMGCRRQFFGAEIYFNSNITHTVLTIQNDQTSQTSLGLQFASVFPVDVVLLNASSPTETMSTSL